MNQESQGYKQMLDEVEGLTRDIAQPDLDLDLLVSKVERGYALIHAMRERLDQTKARIDQLHGQYQDEAREDKGTN